jgi:mannitol/fructose-specific phosphotransferase system IIA component (Ntr-type)
MSNAICETVDASALRLSQVFSPRLVEYFEPGTSKEDSVRQLVAALAANDKLPAAAVDDVIAGVLERETLGTTAMGKGMAFPHLRTSAVDRNAGAIGVSTTGIDFGALDGLPTRVVILVLSPMERRVEHFQILGRLAKLLGDRTIQYTLKIPRTPEQLIEFLGLDSDVDDVADDHRRVGSPPSDNRDVRDHPR